MPYVKKQLFEFIEQQLEHKVRDAQYELMLNKSNIKKLAEKQTYLKQQVAEASRLMFEFKNRRLKNESNK